jgi:hypothetical protein
MNYRELLMNLQDALEKHQHYMDKGWYKIAWNYWNKTIVPLNNKLNNLTN